MVNSSVLDSTSHLSHSMVSYGNCLLLHSTMQLSLDYSIRAEVSKGINVYASFVNVLTSKSNEPLVELNFLLATNINTFLSKCHKLVGKGMQTPLDKSYRVESFQE